LGLPEAVSSPLRPAIPRVVVLGAMAALLFVGLVWFGISSMNAA
jgi:hypothetical protein